MRKGTDEMHGSHRRLILTGLAGLLAACFLSAGVRADVITDWNNVMLETTRTTPLNPPHASRALAMVHTAMYDAVNSIAQTHQPYHMSVPTPADTSREAAAAQAAYRVLSQLFPSQQPTYELALSNSLAGVPDGAEKQAGISLGTTVADAILALRANDRSDEVVAYTPGSAPGEWVPTPPAMAPALLPNWPNVTPWAMTRGDQFRSTTGPPALDSPEYAAYFNEVKLIGAADSVTRTADQTEIAQFWADDPGTATPPGHWNRIAQTVAEARGNTLEDNARLFALLNVGAADAAISCWDNKYAFNDWRPVTAIRQADTDGNPATEPDPDWSSFVTTPPFPTYTSGHSSFSGAAASILSGFFGDDQISFTSSAEGTVVADRSYTSFSQAAEEAMNSRLYGGIHWRYDNEDGLLLGRALGEFVLATQMQPVPEPTSMGGLIGTMLLLIARRRRSSTTAVR